jgi:DNA repair protein RecO (recombination protein O)
MDESKTSYALIIKRGDYREYDSRVVLYTKNFGKIVVVARGVKKFKSKLAGHIEPMSLIKAMILRGRAFDYLGGALVTNSFVNLKNDLNGLYFAGSALALFDTQVKEDEPDAELYDFVAYWLELINEKCQTELHKNQGELLYNYFALQLLTILGYKPELYHCLDCHHKISPNGNYFNLRQGGLVCENCFKISQNKYLPNEVMKVSDDCIKLLRLFSERGSYQSIQVKSELIKELSYLIRSFVIFN